MGFKKPETKTRSAEVDAEILSMLTESVPVFQIARAIPIGEKAIRNLMKEHGIIYPKKVNKIKLERKARRDAKHLEREKKKNENASSSPPVSDNLRVDDARSLVGDIPWSYC
jgi:phage antirepressor YoqD-like protein